MNPSMVLLRRISGLDKEIVFGPVCRTMMRVRRPSRSQSMAAHRLHSQNRRTREIGRESRRWCRQSVRSRVIVECREEQYFTYRLLLFFYVVSRFLYS